MINAFYDGPLSSYMQVEGLKETGRRRCCRLPQEDFMTAAHLVAHRNNVCMQLHEEMHDKGYDEECPAARFR